MKEGSSATGSCWDVYRLVGLLTEQIGSFDDQVDEDVCWPEEKETPSILPGERAGSQGTEERVKIVIDEVSHLLCATLVVLTASTIRSSSCWCLAGVRVVRGTVSLLSNVRFVPRADSPLS
jgi:hypothetical protein